MDTKKTIIKLYEEYVSQNSIPTNEYLKLKDEFSNELEILMDTVSDAEKEKLEKLCDCLFKMSKEQEVNAFVDGYSLGTTLTAEAIHRGIK